MKFHGIQMEGKYTAEIVSSVPAGGDASNKARVIYAEDVEQLLVGDNNGDFGAENTGGIVSGTIMLFEASSSVSGWTMLADVDDQLVYISSSTTGFKSGSTWTQPNHNHGLGSHTHTGSTSTVFANEDQGDGSNSCTNTHNHDVTINAATGNTNDGATTSSWRPTGRNFTRQQKL